MELVTDPRTSEDRLTIEVTWETLRLAVGDAECLTRGGGVHVDIARERYGIAATDRGEALREMFAVIAQLVRALDLIEEDGLRGASLVVPEGGWL